MSHSSLLITPVSPAEGADRAYRLVGNIDAYAREALQPLNEIDGGAVVLDFAEVQRVNSMGLALLLKVFEHADSRKAQIRVIHANRMIAMLFKMTGLANYLISASPTRSMAISTPVAAIAGSRPITVAPPASPQPAADPPSPEPNPARRLMFRANLQNSGQLNGWYFFNTYLQRQLNRPVHLDLAHAAYQRTGQSVPIDLMFAKPFEATKLIREHGFHPMAKPTQEADEIVVLTSAEDPRASLHDYEGARVVSDTAESFTYLLGRFLLDENELDSAALKYSFAGQDIKAVRALLAGDADLLFMQADAYRSLSGITREKLRVLDQSDCGIAFHLFCTSPELDCRDQFRDTLLSMHTDARGCRILEDLGLSGWSEPAREEIDMLLGLFERYREAPLIVG